MKINSFLIGNLIRKVRTQVGLSTADFAKLANVNTAGMNRIENPPKMDFRVSYDNLLNALELAGKFYREQNMSFDFSECIEEPYAKETINLFLMFTEEKDWVEEKIYEEGQPWTTYVCNQMSAMQKPVLEMFYNHGKMEEYQRMLIDAHDAFCGRELTAYKDIESYQDAKADLPNRFKLFERIKSIQEIGNEGSFMMESEVQFQKFIEEPTVENVMKFMEKFLCDIS